MESILDLFQAFSFNALEVMIAGFFLFVIGFWMGNSKVRRLSAEVSSLQRDVLDLNAEVLYGKQEEKQSATPVIEIKTETLKGAKMAK